MLAELIESMRRIERYIFDMPPPHDHFWPTFTDGQILRATQDHGWHRDSHSDWTP